VSSPGTPFDNRQYWESRLREHYSLAGVGYLGLGRRFNEWMYRIRGAVFDRVVTGLGGSWSGAEVLDVGAGTGFYVDRWLRRRGRVTGLDLTEVAVQELSRCFPEARFVRADIGQPLAQVPLAPTSFDAVSAFDVLFHVVDDAQYARAFTNIAALLKPGGWLLWSDNFLRHPTERAAHQVSRTLAESTRCVETAGFQVIDRVPMFVLMNSPVDATSRLARWAWTAMTAPATLGEPIGWILGAALYPIERALVRRMRESPSTELMICRKR
jgi:2-polyprenyl-3-methyl-5-hydroxy-6-metoxy-1,4-benzoquinol methylase